MNIRRLCAIQFRAYKKDDSALCAYKLAKAFDELEKHFGVTEEDRGAVKMPESDKIAAVIEKSHNWRQVICWQVFLRPCALNRKRS